MSGEIVSKLNFKSSLNDEFVEEYELVKRLPLKFSRRKNDVYITTKTNFRAQIKRIKKLLETGNNEVFLHGLGAAIERTVNLALTLEEEAKPMVKIEVSHDSMRVVDDLKNLIEPEKSKTFSRNTPVIHIRLFITEVAPLSSPTNSKKHALVKQRKKKGSKPL